MERKVLATVGHKEINNLDSRIEVLLKENKFKEANELINRYLGEDLKEEYLDVFS